MQHTDPIWPDGTELMAVTCDLAAYRAKRKRRRHASWQNCLPFFLEKILPGQRNFPVYGNC